MEYIQPATWTSNRSLLEASRVKAFPGRPTNPARPYPELRIWREAVSSTIGVVDPPVTRDPPVPVAISPCAVTSHSSHARPASGTSTEPAVTSPDRKMVFKALYASFVPGVLLHYNPRRPSAVPAYCHADVYHVTQKFDSSHHTLIKPLPHHCSCSCCLREPNPTFIQQPDMPSMLQMANKTPKTH